MHCVLSWPAGQQSLMLTPCTLPPHSQYGNSFATVHGGFPNKPTAAGWLLSACAFLSSDAAGVLHLAPPAGGAPAAGSAPVAGGAPAAAGGARATSVAPAPVGGVPRMGAPRSAAPTALRFICFPATNAWDAARWLDALGRAGYTLSRDERAPPLGRSSTRGSGNWARAATGAAAGAGAGASASASAGGGGHDGHELGTEGVLRDASGGGSNGPGDGIPDSGNGAPRKSSSGGGQRGGGSLGGAADSEARAPRNLLPEAVAALELMHDMQVGVVHRQARRDARRPAACGGACLIPTLRLGGHVPRYPHLPLAAPLCPLLPQWTDPAVVNRETDPTGYARRGGDVNSPGGFGFARQQTSSATHAAFVKV